VLVDAIHAARGRCAAIVFNPGAFSHYAYALTDALATFDGVKVEVHLSNPHAREAWRHHSVISPVVDGTVTGFKAAGYRLAIDAAATLLQERRLEARNP
jgi:3-dehydroquinate dehydratase II